MLLIQMSIDACKIEAAILHPPPPNAWFLPGVVMACGMGWDEQAWLFSKKAVGDVWQPNYWREIRKAIQRKECLSN